MSIAQTAAFCLFLALGAGCAFKKSGSSDPGQNTNSEKTGSGTVAPNEAPAAGKLVASWAKGQSGRRSVERALTASESGFTAAQPISFLSIPETLDLQAQSPALSARANAKLARNCEARAWNQIAKPFKLACVVKGEGSSDISIQGISLILLQGSDEAFKIQVSFQDEKHQALDTSLVLSIRALPSRLPSQAKSVWSRDLKVLYAEGTFSLSSILRLTSVAVKNPAYSLIGIIELQGIRQETTQFIVPAQIAGTINRDFIVHEPLLGECTVEDSTTEVREQAQETFLLLPLSQSLPEAWPELLAAGSSTVTLPPGQNLKLGVYSRSPYVDSVLSKADSSWKEQSYVRTEDSWCNDPWTGPGTTKVPARRGRDEKEPSFSTTIANIKILYAQDLTSDREPLSQVVEPTVVNRPIRTE